jgi:hypothetical protein
MKRICFGEFYRDKRIFEVATQLGVELVDLSAVLQGSGEDAPPGG